MFLLQKKISLELGINDELLRNFPAYESIERRSIHFAYFLVCYPEY